MEIGDRVKFEITVNDVVRETLYGTLIESRGMIHVKGDNGRTYDPMGWHSAPDETGN